MSEIVAVPEPSSPLLELLREQFSHSRLRGIVGTEQPPLDFALWEKCLHGPLAEFLSRPGKEFRARLLEACFQLAGGKGAPPALLSTLLELLHAGSLIVDDIEDDSALRRGEPALHRMVGVPVALNAGNWLYFWALSLAQEVGLGPHAELQVHRWLNQTLLGCHYGQALDLSANVGELPQERIPDIVATTTRLKTGSLMQLAAVLGAIAAGARRETVIALGEFGSALGTGLQMLDDHGGLVSEARADKGHEDVRLGRPTWPWAWLAARLSAPDWQALQRSQRAIRFDGTPVERVVTLLKSHLGDEGRVVIHRELRGAFDTLRNRIGNSNALVHLSREIHRMEQSYG